MFFFLSFKYQQIIGHHFGAVPRPWEGQNFNDNYCLLMLWVRRHASIVLPVKAVKGRSVGNQKRLTHRAPVGTMNVDLCPR